MATCIIYNLSLTGARVFWYKLAGEDSPQVSLKRLGFWLLDLGSAKRVVSGLVWGL
ncbi:MAG: hypothetical protein FWD65_02900 [Coriobacteriia bacterium]|nr:hypothetical protein [Coriobacteriia bacterium]